MKKIGDKLSEAKTIELIGNEIKFEHFYGQFVEQLVSNWKLCFLGSLQIKLFQRNKK